MSGASAARFLPLGCPDCGDDLVGRAGDVLAFCAPCETAWRCDRDELERWPAGRVTRPPEGQGAWLTLPVWVSGSLTLPAFPGRRPLSLAKILAREVAGLPAERGVGRPLPLGAQVPPEAISAVAPLLERRAAVDRPPVLLALPVRVTKRHLLLPGSRQVLFPEDVHELRGLLALAAPHATPEPATP